MKTSISIIVITISLTCPLISSASYLIQLKNGREFITYRYGEEGNQIKLYLHGGIVTIPKDVVREIKESGIAYREKKRSTEKPEPISTQTETEKEEMELTPIESEKDEALLE